MCDNRNNFSSSMFLDGSCSFSAGRCQHHVLLQTFFLFGWSAYARVPQVSAMSSTRMATLSTTSPTSTIRPTTLGRGRSLWIRAKPRSRRSAIDVALKGSQFLRPLRAQLSSSKQITDLFAPPASGLTMTISCPVRFSLIHRSTLGSA